ncbi:MAG: DUF937 domain-containing protein [Verrucomicrobiales bacterium]
MNFLDDLMKNLGPQASNAVASRLGIPEDKVQGAMAQVAPMVLGGLKRQMESGGPERVDHILNKYGDPGAVEDVDAAVARVDAAGDHDPDLGGLLGGNGEVATQQFADKLGLDGGMAKKLIPMLAPIILGAITKKRDQGFGDASGAPEAPGEGIGGIVSMLDRDGDGSVLDDVAGMIFGGSQGGSGGGIGDILGGFLGGRR